MCSFWGFPFGEPIFRSLAYARASVCVCLVRVRSRKCFFGCSQFSTPIVEWQYSETKHQQETTKQGRRTNLFFFFLVIPRFSVARGRKRGAIVRHGSVGVICLKSVVMLPIFVQPLRVFPPSLRIMRVRGCGCEGMLI